jgi:hypothetical protein
MKLLLGAAALMVPCIAVGAGAGASVSGLYYFGAEVETFHPCNSKQALWVLGSETSLKPLRERAEKLREAQRKPYPAIYVEFAGRVGPKDTSGGFAENYDGVFHVERVLKVSEIVPKACRP